MLIKIASEISAGLVASAIVLTSSPDQAIIDFNTTPAVAGVQIESDQLLGANNWWSYPVDDDIYTYSLSEIQERNEISLTVNKSFQLPQDYIPANLVFAANFGLSDDPEIQIREEITEDLSELFKAAKVDGHDLTIVSGYRSYETQISTYAYWLNYNANDVDAADKISARPGHSEHQLGSTVDISSKAVQNQLGASFNYSEAYLWLKDNAYRYNFYLSYPQGQEVKTGYSFEGWHWRWYGE